jgi:hypothetical protein
VTTAEETIQAARDRLRIVVPEDVASGQGEQDGARSERDHKLGNPVDDFRWLLLELGARGLSGLFLRGEAVVYVPVIGEEGYIEPPSSADGRPDNDNGPATIRRVDADQLVTRLALNYSITKDVKSGKGKDAEYREVEAFFPRASAVHALNATDQAINLRRLKGVTHTPMVRADGSILDVPGYDDATGFLYLPTVEVGWVPTNPTREHVDWAVGYLRNLISEFTWAGPHDEVNYLGMLMTPLLRELTPPPYKLCAVMAHQPGSGKSLLTAVIRGSARCTAGCSAPRCRTTMRNWRRPFRPSSPAPRRRWLSSTTSPACCVAPDSRAY